MHLQRQGRKETVMLLILHDSKYLPRSELQSHVADHSVIPAWGIQLSRVVEAKKFKLVHVSSILISCPSRTTLEFALKPVEKTYG